MDSVIGYKLRVMELHCILARININIVRYALQICFNNRDKALQRSAAAGHPVVREPKGLYRPRDPLITALVKLKDFLVKSDGNLLWMNYLSEEEAEVILTFYHPEFVLKLLEDIPSKKSLVRYLECAYDVLLGLALELSVPSEEFRDPDNNFFGPGIYPLLNREDQNVCLVLDCLREITSCIDCIQLLDQSERGN